MPNSRERLPLRTDAVCRRIATCALRRKGCQARQQGQERLATPTNHAPQGRRAEQPLHAYAGAACKQLIHTA